jgi:threonine 3-dehydrogenase
MAAAVARHAGARDHLRANEYRQLAERSVSRHDRPRATPLKQIQRQLNMREGFDVGLEMSGNPSAFRDMLPT